jgi:hypothetical protein
MKILWSPDLSLAVPMLNLVGPSFLRSLKGDDLTCYCAARLLTSDIQIFQPGPIAGFAEQVIFDDDGVPNVTEEQMIELSWIVSRIGALQWIYEANPDAIFMLLHAPESIPSDVVASYVSGTQDPSEQVRLHSELVDFLHLLLATLPTDKAGDPFFLTANPFLGRLYLEAQPRLTAQNTLALLATSGIKFALPRVASFTEDEIDKVHESLKEERERYIEELNDTISQCYDALKGGDIGEAYRFAEFRVSTRVQSEASRVERAVRKLDKGFMKRLGIVATEGLPSIARAWVSPKDSWTTELGIQVLSILCKSLGQEWRLREISEEYPIGSYAYKIRRELSSH